MPTALSGISSDSQVSVTDITDAQFAWATTSSSLTFVSSDLTFAISIEGRRLLGDFVDVQVGIVIRLHCLPLQTI